MVLLTAWYVSFQVLLAGEALSAVSAEDHLDSFWVCSRGGSPRGSCVRRAVVGALLDEVHNQAGDV